MKNIISVFTLSLLLAGCGASLPMSVPGLNEQSNSQNLGGPVTNLSDLTAVQNKAIEILSNNCTACHGATAGPLNVYNLTNVAHLIQSGLIIPGNPDASPLLNAVEANRMPKTGALSAADKTILRAWILGGADPAAPVVPNPDGGPPQPSDHNTCHWYT